ncbi:glycosyltransferase [Azospirillum picis]|uniref:GT2 family glycosyltransferase n=1 Tax=Azospirillum picis TaxID=488438 RepID=A0ABU0MTX8_9PROT|nr:glycosyltransferase [Azospirillum picis]MBP2303244.1 GT2 family glycosyltransferase [Azospirillum picis]MDQ0536949.1 GT2 family glycosyltransferase [Azospirillum picis]
MQRHPCLAPYSLTNLERANAIGRAEPQQLQGAPAPHGLSIIILTLDKPELIIPLVDSLVAMAPLFAQAGLGFEVLIGDTGSTDPDVLAFYEQVPAIVTVVRGLSYQFSRCNNQLFFGHARYDTALFLNNDVIVRDQPDSLLRMVRLLECRPQLGVVGLCLFFPDGLVQHAGIDVFRDGPLRGFCFHPHARAVLPRQTAESWESLAVTGACLMIRAELFRAVGGFDEGYRTECQDVALCLAVQRLGRGTAVLNAGPVLHLENATRPRGSEDWADRQLFMRRWGTFVDAFAL